MFSPSRILVPTDFSKFSDLALQKALDIARQYKARLHVLHVTPIAQHWPTGYSLNLEIPTIEDYESQSIGLARQLLEEQIKKAVQNGDIEITSDVISGRPYEAILRESRKRDIDLIVICSHGRTGVVSHLIGSVALKVAQHATCPVLLVRGI